MSKSITTITLDSNVKEAAQKIIYSEGETLSGVINNFLIEIIEREARKKKNGLV